MASTKLTKELRNSIVDNALKGAFQQEIDALNARTVELTKQVYRQWVSEDEEKRMNEFPHGFFFFESGKVQVHLCDENGVVIPGVGITMGLLDFGDGVRLPASRAFRRSRKVQNKELSMKLYELEMKYAEIQKKKDSLREEITAVVQSVKTTAKLVEIWPEAERFIPQEENPKANNLPAVLIDSLNKTLFAARPELAA